MRFNGRATTDAQELAALVVADGASGGFIKDSERATAAQARAGASTSAVLTPSNFADAAAFRAYLSTNQTGIADVTATLVAVDTEVADIGGLFAASLWTPPAGRRIFFRGQVLWATTNFTVADGINIYIYKNGTAGTLMAAIQGNIAIPGSNYQQVACTDLPNGTDTYGLYVAGDTTGAGAMTLIAGAAITFCEGWQL
jgi:hypothetical protein